MPESSPTERARKVLAEAITSASAFPTTITSPRAAAENGLAALLADPELLLSVMEEAGTVEQVAGHKAGIAFVRYAEPLYRVVYRKAETDE